MNSNRYPFLFDENEYDEVCREFIENRSQLYAYATETKNEYRIILRFFRRWMIEKKHAELDEKVVKLWILDCVQKTTVRAADRKVMILTHFMDYLISRNLWYENPFNTLLKQHYTRGCRGMVRVLQETGSTAALDKLADTPFSGALASHFTDYLDHVSALGISPQTKNWVLNSFERYLRKHDITDLKQIDASVVTAWNDWVGQASEYQKRRRMAGLKKFFDFLVGQERIQISPVPQLLPYCREYSSPYIFSREEIRNILAASEKLPDHRLMPYRGATYRMIFLSLYTLGLRINEALNLRLADIDFVQDSVTIRDTKFHKGRVLPFGPRFKAALQRYITGHPLLIKAAREDYLFPSRSCHTNRIPRLCYGSCQDTLNLILKEISVTPPAATMSPRLHSFRHSFAVHRLENWIREGADIGAKLTLLVAFLGHINIVYTQKYLTMTPERLALLGEQFEKAFGILPQTEEVLS